MSADAEHRSSISTNNSTAAENNPEIIIEEAGGTDNNNMNNKPKKSMTSAQKLSIGNKISTSKQPTINFGDGGADSGDGEEHFFNSDSELSDSERNFLTKGAFLLTPSNELTLAKAGTICEKMNFKGPFSLTKTATGILFKFAEPDDCVAVYKKGFHKVTNARFYKKIIIPCRPMRTFVVYALDVPEAVPVEDIRHALYKFQSVVEVSRMISPGSNSSGGENIKSNSTTTPPSINVAREGEKTSIVANSSAITATMGTNNAVAGFCPLVRITLGSQEEANTLLQNGLDFYGATFFPTETAKTSKKNSVLPATASVAKGIVSAVDNTIQSGNAMIGTKIRELLPVFDASGYNKISAPAERTVKPK